MFLADKFDIFVEYCARVDEETSPRSFIRTHTSLVSCCCAQCNYCKSEWHVLSHFLCMGSSPDPTGSLQRSPRLHVVLDLRGLLLRESEGRQGSNDEHPASLTPLAKVVPASLSEWVIALPLADGGRVIIVNSLLVLYNVATLRRYLAITVPLAVPVEPQYSFIMVNICWTKYVALFLCSSNCSNNKLHNN